MISSRRILLIEDHPTMRSAVRAILETEGYRVAEAADGQTGIDDARRDPPDVVVLDLNIPGVSGEEVLRRLKSDPATAQVAIVIATAEGEEGRASVMRMGADDYVTKPFAPAVLLTAVARALEGTGSRGG